jgi:hypothetical protein
MKKLAELSPQRVSPLDDTKDSISLSSERLDKTRSFYPFYNIVALNFFLSFYFRKERSSSMLCQA